MKIYYNLHIQQFKIKFKHTKHNTCSNEAIFVDLVS